MTITTAHIQPIVALIAGVLILIMPRFLNLVVAIYLICVGLFDLGVLTLRSGDRSIRFRPALDITAEVVDEAMGLIRQYCRKRK